MILIFASSLQSYDPQTRLLEEVLASSGKEHCIINPLNSQNLSALELTSDQRGVRLSMHGKQISPSSVYLSRLWRSDCLIDLPEGCSYPTYYRQKVEAFLFEIASALRDSIWFPGRLHNIGEADAKCLLYKEAVACGLNVPEVTVNSFGSPTGITYRKVIGYPFSISYNSDAGEEVVVTFYNSTDTKKLSDLELPWQWQRHIQPTLHIRCVAVGDKIWAACADENQFNGLGLREVQEEVDVLWQEYLLPDASQRGLLQLMEKMEIEMCCPEFLVDDTGNHILIDLNPCGDWYGFFNQDTHHAIAKAVVEKL